MTLPHKAVQLCGQLNVRFWCFVFVLRCLIYKVHATSSSGERMISYHKLKSLSSTFFKFFQNSFVHSVRGPVSRGQLAYISTPQRKSQPLIFSFFEIFPHFLSSGGSTSQKTLDLQGLFHIPAFLIQREKQGLPEQSSFFANRMF